MSIYYQDDAVTLHHGDALDVLREMDAASVACCVTSPPYFGLRDYGTDGQYGMEESPAEYVDNMRALFTEVRRVLADDGTLWLNIGDSYYSGRGNPGPNSADEKNAARRGWVRPVDRPGQSWGRPKSLLGIPWRLAFALQDDGWTLRNDIIWAKPNAMPESVADRLANRHEHLFMLTKSRNYWFDLDPIREAHSDVSIARAGRARKTAYAPPGQPPGRHKETTPNALGKNPGDVWEVPTAPFPGAHFAVMPPELARRAILTGCKPGGVVLDPFSGSGTTGMVAGQAGRRYVGIELSADYLDLSLRTRLQQAALIGEASA